MATLLNPFLRALDANADSVSGGLLYVFEAGTTTPVTTYSDRAMTTPQAQPLVANAAGEFAGVFVPSGNYKIRVADSGAVVLYENDNVRMADRPDDPVSLDDEAAVAADATSYADGAVIFAIGEATYFEVAPSGATAYDLTNAAGEKLRYKNRNYTTVAAMVASAEASRGVGDVWEAQGFRYEEAASGATDHHLTTAGGVKLYVVQEERGFNGLSFGAAGDGVTDDTASIQAMIDAGNKCFLPAGTYQASNILIDGGTEASGGKLIDFGDCSIVNEAGNGESLFVIASQDAVNFLKLKGHRFRSGSGNGHIFDIQGAVNHSQISVDYVRQAETTKRIINHDDTSFFFNTIEGVYWAISTSHTVSAITFSSTSNKVSANKFSILRPDRSGTHHFMEILSTSGSDYNYSNKIDLSNPEVCAGGVLKLQRTFNTEIGMMNCFDTGTTTNHMVEVGASGYISQNTKIRSYQRNSGTLGSGLADIFLGDANYTYIEAPCGVSTATTIEIDINNESNTTVVGGGFYNISNATETNTVLMSANEGISTPKLALTPQSTALEISAGAITVTDSIHSVDTEGLAASDDLETINGGISGQVLILRCVANARDVTLQDGAGNMHLAGDFTLTRDRDTITLRYDDSLSAWVELSRSDNAT